MEISMKLSKRCLGHLLKHLLFTLLVITSSQSFAEGKTTFYHYDLLGSPVATTDQAGNVLWREEYSPWGEKLLKEDASHDNVRDYTGHVHDKETGLTYMQARYYDPQIGRFMGVDPVGFKEGNTISFNRYGYANNNPFKFTDPNGEEIGAVNVSSDVDEAISNIKSTSRGQELWGKMEKSKKVINITSHNGAARETDTRYFDNKGNPTGDFELVTRIDVRIGVGYMSERLVGINQNDKSVLFVPSITRALAHEFGHTVGDKDDGGGFWTDLFSNPRENKYKMATVNKWETPIMNQLGSKVQRTGYKAHPNSFKGMTPEVLNDQVDRSR